MLVRHFCTYFDSQYLARGLALIESLREHCPAFKLWILCFDERCYFTILSLRRPELMPISLSDFEAGDSALAATKSNRSRVEYFFTCTPALPLFVLRAAPEIDVLTYLDADLFFYSSPDPLFEEFSQHSVAIIAHRFSPSVERLQFSGIYNVGFLIFRNDANGLACLKWWRERCIEWCYLRAEIGRFGDQKYLDDWPSRFGNVIVLEHKGANVAVWNLSNHPITHSGSAVLVGDQPLIFYHFHGFKQKRSWLYDLNTGPYSVVPNDTVIRQIYAPYIRALHRLGGETPSTAALSTSVIEPLSEQEISAPFVERLRYRKGRIKASWQHLLERRRMVVFAGRIATLPCPQKSRARQS
jgi:hypothetical protein